AQEGALGEGVHETVPEDGRLLRHGRPRGGEIVRMHVNVPEPWEEECAAEIDDVRLSRIRRSGSVEHLGDAAILDGDAGARDGRRVDAVEQGGVDKPGPRHAGSIPQPAMAPRGSA